MSDAETRPSLLLRLRDAEDASAWNTFVDVYSPLVFGECRRRGLAHADAEDVTQRVFARVVQAIRTFEYARERGRFRGWLGTIVRNEIHRYWKERGQAPVTAGLDGVLDVAAEATDPLWDEAFQTRVLKAALDRCEPHFEPATWHAFQLAWIENRSAAAVATELNQPIDWVYVAKSRVLSRLQRTVAELSDDLPI